MFWTNYVHSVIPYMYGARSKALRIMYKALQAQTKPARGHTVARLAAIPAGVSLFSVWVHAACEEKHDKRSLKVDELSLYTTPEQHYKFVESEPTQLEEGIAELRKATEPISTWCQGVITTTKPKVESSLQFGKDSYEFLKAPPPGFYPRVGVIGFAGIVGLFLARGSKVKKLAYPVTLMTVAASLYFPQQAANIAKVTGEAVYDWSLQGYVAVESLWKDNSSKKSAKKQSPKSEAASADLDSSSNTPAKN
ncbi:MICOS complex subunit MIC26-like isoform X2 [Acipenser ruthenus]|uniref:MICOS complex subunit MIC26-like isoform X2 n=1 Tax=Acipenser ruthenus TaxID=7906 RepID=UPI002741500A|nr:MICOS complex subunit MIC26-like isoform X2 [Acipenser ruthenus]